MSVTAKQRDAVLERDGHSCAYCGKSLRYSVAPHDRCPEFMVVVGEYPTIDHALPKARGGGNDIENLRAACGFCNSQKGGKTPAEYAAWKEARA